jgi:hypothetical protein
LKNLNGVRGHHMLYTLAFQTRGGLDWHDALGMGDAVRRPGRATHCFTTSNVAIIVVAMPFTGHAPSPSTILSTLWARHGTPTFWRMLSITWSCSEGAGRLSRSALHRTEHERPADDRTARWMVKIHVGFISSPFLPIAEAPNWASTRFRYHSATDPSL